MCISYELFILALPESYLSSLAWLFGDYFNFEEEQHDLDNSQRINSVLIKDFPIEYETDSTSSFPDWEIGDLKQISGGRCTIDLFSILNIQPRPQ